MKSPKNLANLAAFADQVNSITREELIDKALPTVSELLPGCTAIGAYCLGAVNALAWQDYVEVPRNVLELAAKCTSVRDAVELYREFRAGRTAGVPAK
jgi:hypothetical protein